MDSKICLGYLLGKECPDSKNSGVLKTAESDNFKNVNYIVIGRFLTILWRFSQKRHGYFWYNNKNYVFVARITIKSSKIVRLLYNWHFWNCQTLRFSKHPNFLNLGIPSSVKTPDKILSPSPLNRINFRDMAFKRTFVHPFLTEVDFRTISY